MCGIVGLLKTESLRHAVHREIARLTQAVGVAGLPAVAKTPQMIQPLSSNSRVSMVKLTSEELSPMDGSVPSCSATAEASSCATYSWRRSREPSPDQTVHDVV